MSADKFSGTSVPEHHLSCLSQAPPTTLTWRLVLGHVLGRWSTCVHLRSQSHRASRTGVAMVGANPATPPVTPPDQFTVSSKGNEGALSQVRFSGAGEDVAVYIYRLQPVSEPEQPENFFSIFFTLHHVIPEENARRRCHGTGAARTEPIGSSELLQRPLFLITVRIAPSAGCQVGHSPAAASTRQLNTPEEKCTQVLDASIQHSRAFIPNRTQLSQSPSSVISGRIHHTFPSTAARREAADLSRRRQTS